MSDSIFHESNQTDESLVARTRLGERRAFGELWSRHYRSGVAMARSFTNLDPDDLVSEAFARIYQRTLDGGGPRGAFRPYLYTTIRNLACTWGTARAKSVNVDELDEQEPTESAEEPVARSLDRTLTVQAYRSLPERWQTVLWYTEVEGLDPSEVAPKLGMSANSVAALSYRAREGLRKAWLQAHVSDASATGTCGWVIDRVGEHARRSLTPRETAKLESHLATCAKCRIVSAEVDDVGARLAMVMIPLLITGVVGGTALAAASTAATAAVTAAGAGAGATSAAAASVSGASAAGATATGGVVGATVGSGGVLAVAASTVLVAAVGVGTIGYVQDARLDAPDGSTSNAQQGSLADPLNLDAAVTQGSVTPVDPAAIPLAPTAQPMTDAATAVPTPAPSPTKAPTEPTPEATTAPPTAVATPEPVSEKQPVTEKTTTPTKTDKPGKTATDIVDPVTTVPVPTPAVTSVPAQVTDVAEAATGTVDKTVEGTTSTVDSVVKGTTSAVDSIVDGVLPTGTGTGVGGTVNGTVDGLTG